MRIWWQEEDDDGREAGRYTAFVRGGRAMALERWLGGCEAALRDAEEQMDALIEKVQTPSIPYF